MFQAPKTVFNWIKLAKQGKYDDVVFHRLIPGFMVCPLDSSEQERTHIFVLDTRWRPHRNWLGRHFVLGIEFPG